MQLASCRLLLGIVRARVEFDTSRDAHPGSAIRRTAIGARFIAHVIWHFGTPNWEQQNEQSYPKPNKMSFERGKASIAGRRISFDIRRQQKFADDSGLRRRKLFWAIAKLMSPRFTRNAIMRWRLALQGKSDRIAGRMC
jgi:hypothetical protein